MGANNFYGFIDQPSRSSAFSDVAKNVLGMLKQQEETKLANIWAPAAKLDPQGQQEYFNSLPPDVQAKLRAKGVNVAPVPMSPEQQNARGLAGLNAGLIHQAQDAQQNNRPFTPDQLVAGFANPDLAGKAPWMGQAGQRYNYANQGQLPAEVPQAQKVSDSLAEGMPDQLKREQQNAQFAANQKQQQSQFDTEIGLKRPLIQAQIGAQNAEAGLRAAQTQDIKASGGANQEVANSVVQGVITDPQSYYGLPNDQKKIVAKTLRRVPSKLAAAEIDRMNAAKLGRELVDDSAQIVEKWQQRGVPITGPVLGRFNEKSGQWGEALIPKNLSPAHQAEYQQDIAQLREWLTALPVQEAKALAGGRTAYQVIQAVTSVSPSLSKGKEMFAGSVNGLRRRFDQIYNTLDDKQWGGKRPDVQGIGGGSQSTSGPSVGAIKQFPNGKKGQWDGHGWVEVP